jgi:glycosyltransferase-like protein
MRPLSVGLFTYSTLPRGSVVHAANLADALHDAGIDVTLYTLDKDGRGFFRSLRARLALVAASPTPGSTSELVETRAAELADHLAKVAPAHDIYHAEDCLTANGVLQHRSRGHAIDLVRTVHHVEAFTDPRLAACQRRSIQEAAVCLAVSEATAGEVSRDFGVQARLVTNGVDFDRFGRVDPSRLAAWSRKLRPEAGPAVLVVGGVEERKNTCRTLRAFARLREAVPGARLWILGGATVLDHGAYRGDFDRELASLPAEARTAVIEIGVVADEDVPAIFGLASVLAFPSLHEGFGLAALEALAAGLPVVASRRPPLTEFLDDSCAVLVDPTSAAGIALGIFEALQGPRARIEAGQRRARAHSWSRVAAMHVEHYRALAAAQPSASWPGGGAAVRVLEAGETRSRRDETVEVDHA